MNDNDIIRKSDAKSKKRSKSNRIQARLYKVEDNKIFYTVSSSHRDKQYLVTIQLLDLTSDKLKSLQQALNGDLRISCTCPAFSFMGYKYITYKTGCGIEKETRSPDIKNPNKEGMACKHILAALEQMKFDYNQIYSLFKKIAYTRPQEKSLKDNSESNEPTERDIEIIEDFQSACSELYKEYSEYLKNKDVDSFYDSKFYKGSDPSKILLNLSKPVLKTLSNKFIGKCKSLDDIINLMETKKNSFNILIDSDVKSLIRKLISIINTTTESLINNIILNLIGD